MEPLLKAEHLTVCYNGVPAVRDVSFQLKEGEILGIVGESGSGKSTILRAVLGLLGKAGRLTQGNIWYRGKNLTELTEKQMRLFRGPEIGTVFQDSKSALCPVRTIGAQIYEAMRAHERVSKKESWRRAGEMLEKIGLTDWERILRSYPFELSGGMNQRVGICIAVMMRPSLLLADEPTSALDMTVQKQVAEELLFLRQECRSAMILVTHNMGLVEKMSDTVLVLKDGETREYGDREWVLKEPKDGYTRELMDSVLRLKREVLQ